jgi:hypothetical protein
MDFYMYKSSCPRWYALQNDIRHIVVAKDTKEDDVKEQAKQTANTLTGSKTCNIQLIQKYHMIIQPKKSYAALTHLTFHGQNTPYTISPSTENKNDI